MDWKLFIKYFLQDVNVKRALGVVLAALITLIPGLSNEVRAELVVLILTALFIWAGVQNAHVEYIAEIEYRASKAEFERDKAAAKNESPH